MKRAIVVTLGTVTGLAAVLSYSDGTPAITDLASTAGPVEGLGAPDGAAAPAPAASPTQAADSPTASASPTARPTKTGSTRSSATPTPKVVSPAPSASSASPRSASPSPTPSKSRQPSSTSAPKPPSTAAPAPRATTSSAPAPAPTKDPSTPPPASPSTSAPPSTTAPPAANGDFVGPVVTHRYGPVQVGIRVVDGVITKAWAVVYPTGSSSGYSSFAIPKLSAETVGTRTAQVAIVSGATLTSKAWITSLSGAMNQAGI